jgi:hypothetical protein
MSRAADHPVCKKIQQEIMIQLMNECWSWGMQ